VKKEVIFELKAIYRDNMRINAYRFGSGEKSAVIVSGIRGNEVQQIFCGSQLVAALKMLESEGRITKGKSVLIVPCVNPYSVNVERRFWPTDNTDINRMFPGYNLGETTQRIAAGVFEAIQGFEYSIHLTSNYIPGAMVPHVRIMDTGWDYHEDGKKFGLKYLSVRKPRPYDTATLNYNWQIWESKAFSILMGPTSYIDEKLSNDIVEAVLRFLNAQGIIDYEAPAGYETEFFEESELVTAKCSSAGIFRPNVNIGDMVKKGDAIARIFDSCDGSLKTVIRAPVDGEVLTLQIDPLAYAGTSVAKIKKI